MSFYSDGGYCEQAGRARAARWTWTSAPRGWSAAGPGTAATSTGPTPACAGAATAARSARSWTRAAPSRASTGPCASSAAPASPTTCAAAPTAGPARTARSRPWRRGRRGPATTRRPCCWGWGALWWRWRWRVARWEPWGRRPAASEPPAAPTLPPDRSTATLARRCTTTRSSRLPRRDSYSVGRYSTDPSSLTKGNKELARDRDVTAAPGTRELLNL
ncbi:uncharacterized protein LOC114242609 isoform X2 [Bombyx mandarina]|uniref:Uncharacterized protein LOC114242609 isoform X2 n=1 Tax=Bombyx mandarina TaxID=7092 RepID=A0A6J2JJA4_BOMMA|nr:uncharacterized protein LOC114242609 isoform X2 [Bombyx mandarina]